MNMMKMRKMKNKIIRIKLTIRKVKTCHNFKQVHKFIKITKKMKLRTKNPNYVIYKIIKRLPVREENFLRMVLKLERIP
jgi:hypothetical protein